MRTYIFAMTLALSTPFALSGVGEAAEPCTKAAVQQASTDDRRTTTEVLRRIADEASVSPRARLVMVTTSDGVVTLRGAIDRSEDRLVLASLAESAPGVRRVEDRLEVRRQ